MASSSITTTTVSGTTRVTGLSSGIDVDSIVEQLVTAEKAKKLNKLQQKEQLSTWRQEAYQDIITEIQAFSNKYLNVTSSTSLLSSKNYNKLTVTSSSSAVAATYTSAAKAGTHSVYVSQLATAAKVASSGLSQDVAGGQAASYSSLSGKSIALTVDGTDYTVDLSDVSDLDSLQSAVDDAVGSGKLTVGTNTSGCLTITAEDDGVSAISVGAPASGTSGLSDLGFAATGAVTANRLDTDKATLADIAEYMGFTFNDDDQLELTVNGVSITPLDSSTTVAEMIEEINDSDCGATMAYDEASGELVLTSAKTGAGNLLTVSDSGGSFMAAVMTAATGGQDAKLTVDGVALTRSSNTVAVDGVTYTLNAVTDSDGDKTADAGETATVTLTQDTDGVYELISDFVEDYNSLIATLNDLVDEDYDSDYPPLTDDQKAEMTDEEIESWETKAKTGILEDDDMLTGFLHELRSAMVDSVSGVSASIFSIGIDTGDYSENGKLEIDEDALKEAIASDATAVMNLFSKQSSTYSGTATVRTLSSSQLSTRYGEEGIAYRFYDVIAEYTSTLKDSSGARGKLVEKAGIADSNIAADNSLSELIAQYQEDIEDEEDRLDDYQERLYSKYTSLETYISKMNSQLSSLSSYLNTESS
ncbi:MAG TPA: flagellar filament capping protein FliD [Negativicutes bacterium]|nr:flagellar filament capping protein FliD [Negativicutes bacterium]